MRRHVAALVVVALMLTIAAPVTAADPTSGQAALPSPAASTSPSPSTDPGPTPTAAPLPSDAPAAEPAATDAATAASPAAIDGAAAKPPRAVAPAATPPASSKGAADPAGRWIVLYRAGTDAVASSARQAKRGGFHVERTFSHAAKGFVAKMSARQAAALREDSSVVAVVPDERIELTAQSYPTGINRIGARKSLAAKIDGVDERVDADVAIVDTGITPLADLNVVGGYNCSSTDRLAWRDGNGHGTHVAGTVGAIDNAVGVVGVAPGVRLWAVRILNSSGSGLLSWYVCGLDWIAAQRDPSDSNRPLFEAVNMSVTKWGRDDRNCGLTNKDVLHQSICRLVASGVTVVAAAANDSANAAYRVPASYNEVITVSALADTDGKAGALGGHRCFSWGSYDSDDTFANFSNYGGDVDLIAPGKCIWSTVPGGYQYMSGTSMAAPHVTGAVALLKSTRPGYTPLEVKQALQNLGNTNWKTSTDPDAVHERLLDITRLGPRGDFTVSAGAAKAVGEAGGKASLAIGVVRSSTFFDRVDLRATGLPSGFSATFSQPGLLGYAAVSSTLVVSIPSGTRAGTYPFTVTGTEHDHVRSASASVVVTNDNPTANAPKVSAWSKGIISTTTITANVGWSAATDPTSPIGGYEIQSSIDGGAWGPTMALGPSIRAIGPVQSIGHLYQYRIRAKDTVGNWSPWMAGPSVRSSLVQNGSSSVAYVGTWHRQSYKYASGGSVNYATAAGASAKITFSGRSVAIVGPVGPGRGSVKIYVDGVYRTTVSFRAAANRSRKVMYTTTLPTLGTHSIRLRLAGNGRVDLDAFVIYR
jgi:subtilisin family serine protease